MTDIPPPDPGTTPTDPPPPPEPPAEPRPTLLERLGPRAVRRMTPRVGVVIAGAGALIAVGGATGLGGDQLIGDDGDVQRIPGILLSLLLVVAGYAALARFRTGPLASAGATGAALGVPVLLFFLTFSESDFPPFSLDAILLVSSLAWLGAYVVGAGAGRLLFLGAALAGSWLFVLNLVEPVEHLTPFGAFAAMESFETSGSLEVPGGYYDEDGTFVFEDDFAPDDFAGDDFFGDSGAPSPLLGGGFDYRPPDFTDVAVISLLFGIGYAVVGLLLSRRGYAGAGTPFAAVSIAALALGVQLIAPDLEQVGTGVLAIALGIGLAAVGAASGRRVTAWVGAAGVGLGAIAVLQKGVDGSSASAQSGAFLLLGIAVVCAGQLLSTAFGEPDEEDELASLTPGASRAGREPGPPTVI
ncbi:MAG TPA: hypothetical protein VM262_06520 [Acidimicrobiales bacterium]|nr:hypothetical protein [Acidimicrobiales bacterium]